MSYSLVAALAFSIFFISVFLSFAFISIYISSKRYGSIFIFFFSKKDEAARYRLLHRIKSQRKLAEIAAGRYKFSEALRAEALKKLESQETFASIAKTESGMLMLEAMSKLTDQRILLDVVLNGSMNSKLLAIRRIADPPILLDLLKILPSDLKPEAAKRLILLSAERPEEVKKLWPDIRFALKKEHSDSAFIHCDFYRDDALSSRGSSDCHNDKGVHIDDGSGKHGDLRPLEAFAAKFPAFYNDDDSKQDH
ncbi:MAG: hypothetical protein LBU32_05485 [Clostridiales bacterium]|jgi:hypothetical protein|nr:hypothetical protein [Clostridiales bacterium]